MRTPDGIGCRGGTDESERRRRPSEPRHRAEPARHRPGRPAPALAACLAAILPACGDGPTGLDLEPAVDRALRTITAAELAAHAGAIAHDSMRGRATPGAGLEATADYVRARFQEIGLRPAAGGEYEHRFPVFGEGESAGVNVVGLLPGADAGAAGEYVVASAHMDHLGVGPPVEGDSIYNGADDNASGVAALLEIAEAIAALDPPPARSVVFAAFGAEERGLVGSGWFVADEVVPVGSTVAALNMDMVARNGPDSIAVLRSSPAIGALADAIGARHRGLGLTIAPDPWPEENLIRRSDQHSFVVRGVPALLVTSGLHADYHRPSDEPGRLDTEKAERVAKLSFLIALDLLDPRAWP